MSQSSIQPGARAALSACTAPLQSGVHPYAYDVESLWPGDGELCERPAADPIHHDNPHRLCQHGLHSCIPAITLATDDGGRLFWCAEHVDDAQRYRPVVDVNPTDRRCRTCGATSGLRYSTAGIDPLSPRYAAEWECVGTCPTQPDGEPLDLETELARIAEETGEPIEIVREMHEAMQACGDEERIERQAQADHYAQLAEPLAKITFNATPAAVQALQAIAAHHDEHRADAINRALLETVARLGGAR